MQRLQLVILGSMWMVIPLLAAGCGGSSGSGGMSPTSPDMPSPVSGSASFRIVGNGTDRTISYGGSNLILCSTNAGFADLFVRLAEEQAGNGENGPHLDMDLCGANLSGSYEPLDPTSATCSGTQAFATFWHGEGDVVYQNDLMSSPCLLNLARDGNNLFGDFSCSGLREFGGTREVDVLDGTFQCAIQ